LKAIEKILPLMKEQHLSYAKACKEKYGDETKSKVYEKLPPVLLAAPGLKQPHLLQKPRRLRTCSDKNIPQKEKGKNKKKSHKSYSVRNPLVLRAMTELRKVVNAVIREYGLPANIHIELARDMKKCRKARERYKAQADANKAQRKRIEEQIEKIHGKAAANNEYNILKWRFAEECNWECPYTGKKIIPRNINGLKLFDIEHIIPFSRSLDDSFANKTLCDPEYNRNVKKNHLPCELPNYSEILDRVKNFTVSSTKKKNDADEQNEISDSKNKSNKSKSKKSFHPKLKLFQMETIPEDFTSRMLNDTRYVSKAAGDYLGLLYGGQSDVNGRQRIYVSTGGMTAYLCRQWKLYKTINEDEKNKKNRNDHRHHAIDAVAIALCSPTLVKEINSEAVKASERYEKGKGWSMPDGNILSPIKNLFEQVEKAVKNINVSRRINRKISGSLHEDTNYSAPKIARDKHGKPVEYRHTRKPLQNMSKDNDKKDNDKKGEKNDIENIVDPTIRRLVQEKLERLGGNPKKFTEKELPYIKTKSGRIIPIRKARIRKNLEIMTLAPNTEKERHVASETNHHIEIFEVLDMDGNVKKLDWKCVNLFESTQRARAKQSVIARSDHYGDGTPTRLKFSLAKGEYVQATPPNEPTVLLRVCKISEGDMSLCLHSDARQEALRKEKKSGQTQSDFKKYRIGIKKLKQFNLRKVTVDLLGNIHPAND
jgi:CRISPR-associated endonuclease Csn1